MCTRLILLLYKNVLTIEQNTLYMLTIQLEKRFTWKTPVLASDVTGRPQKTILFKNRNVDDLFVNNSQ